MAESDYYEELEFRSENPYSKAYYELAKEKGERMVSSLKLSGLTPEQINSVLATMSVELGLDGAMPATHISSQHKAMLENREAFQHAGDWTLAVVTEAQKDLAKTGERIIPGNDLRKKDAAPQNKYQPPIR